MSIEMKTLTIDNTTYEVVDDTARKTIEEMIENGAGQPGADGKDGVSVTHSWNGTTLTVTSASGTSSTNLKGDTGATGAQGIGITKITITEV